MACQNCSQAKLAALLQWLQSKYGSNIFTKSLQSLVRGKMFLETDCWRHMTEETAGVVLLKALFNVKPPC